MSSIIDEQMAAYHSTTLEGSKLALREIVQSIVLVGLSKTDFFSKASFYGGTSLRIFYGLNRFSEDLDFTLNKKDSSFSLRPFFETLKSVAASYGLGLTMVEKEKKAASPVESAFAKLNTYETFLTLSIDESQTSLLHKDETMKIKFEVDKEPSLGFVYETKWLTKPEFAPVRILDLPSLFAGKIHAVLCRNYKNAIKGRDYYDFLFYVSKSVSPNLDYLRNKLIGSGRLSHDDAFSLESMKKMLRKRFAEVDFSEVSKDASRFLTKPEDLSFYSESMFDSVLDSIQ